MIEWRNERKPQIRHVAVRSRIASARVSILLQGVVVMLEFGWGEKRFGRKIRKEHDVREHFRYRTNFGSGDS